MGLRTLLAFAIVYVGWGSTYLAVRVAVQSVPPFLVGAVRNLVAGAVLVAVAAATGAERPGWPAIGRAFAVGALLFVANHGAIGWASTRNPSAITALLVATIPLWILVLEWASGRHHRPSPRAILGLSLGFIGSLLLFWPTAGAPVLDLTASIVTAVAAVSWATGTLVARRAHVSSSVAMATGLPMLLGGVALALVASVAGEWRQVDVARIPPSGLTAVAYLIILGSLLGYSAYLFLLKTMPASRVATYAYVNPVVALAVGAWFGGEAIGPTTLVAAAVSLAGVYLSVSDT